MSRQNGGDPVLDHLSAVIPVEQAVLGCLLLENDVRFYPLDPGEFTLTKHALIFEAMRTLHRRGDPIDVLLVAQQLQRTGEFDLAGGHAELAMLLEFAATRSYLPRYVAQIRDAYRDRRVRMLGEQMTANGATREEIEQAARELPGPIAPDIFDAQRVWQDVEASWSEEAMPTGLVPIDRAAVGFRRGDFLVIGGRTSMAKTGFSVDLSLRLAKRGLRVEYFALEERREQILRRAVANITGLSMRQLRDGHLSVSDLYLTREVSEELKAYPWGVTDLRHLRSLEDHHIVGAVSASDASIIVVDHLQKIGTKDHSRVYGLEHVCNDLHAIALRDGKVIILTAQLNRESEKDKRPPTLSDLRDSGSIEILARSVWLLYWPKVHDESQPMEKFQVYIAKQGEGGVESVTLAFTPSCGQFAAPSFEQLRSWGPDA